MLRKARHLLFTQVLYGLPLVLSFAQEGDPLSSVVGSAPGSDPEIMEIRADLGAFPDAKVILTTRPGEEWYESASRTIYQASPGPLQKLRILMRLPFNAKLRRVLPVFKIIDYLWDEVFEGRFADRDFAIRKFEEMNEKVIRTVPKEKLLVYEVKDGWEPLCNFLGLPVPDTPFPRTNHRSGFHKKLKRVRKGQLPLEMLQLEKGVEV